MLIAVVIGVAGIGVLSLKIGLAAQGNIIIRAVDVTNNQGVAGIPVGIHPKDAANTPSCSNSDMNTDSIGYAAFANCETSPANYLVYRIDASWAGYQVAGNSAIKIGSVVYSSGGNTYFYLNVTPVDSDGDGFTDGNVPNHTQDACPNQSAPRTTNGCPAPAPSGQPDPPPNAPPGGSTNPAPITPAAPTNTTLGNASAPKPAAKPKAAVTKVTPVAAPAVVTATSGDTTAPTVPGNLTIELDGSTTYLSWTDSSDNTGVAGYNVERSTDSENWQSLADKIGDTFYADDSLQSGAHYYYRVRAVDAAGNLSEATIAEITIPSKKSANKTGSPAIKKTSHAKMVPILAGIILLIGAIGGVIWLLWRRANASISPYDTAPASAPDYQPPANYQHMEPAAHTSVSLKDLVLDDLRNQQRPPQPPLPPPPMPPAPPTA